MIRDSYLKDIDKKLLKYIKHKIIPQYDNFDQAHQREHAYNVINHALELTSLLNINVNLNLILATAAYHDLGLGYFADNLSKSRKLHHKYSQIIVKKDQNLINFFSPEEIKLIAQSCHDHRASLQNEPASIYGKIIADADRMDGLEIEQMIIRCWNYSLSYDPGLTTEERYTNIYKHLQEKYGPEGYAYDSFYLEESKELKAAEIANNKLIINREEKLKERFNRLLKAGKIFEVS